MLAPIRFMLVALALGLATGGCSDDAGSSRDEPSFDEIADLRYTREEEKLARDVYLVLYEEWELQVFSNIAGSEQRHADAVAKVMEAMGIEDPVADEAIGVFVDPDLAALYDEMVGRGLISALDGLHVGATIEEVDMVDIRSALDRSDDPIIGALYESLLCGSRNHLRAYAGALRDAGYPYSAQSLDAAELEKIVYSPREQCGTI